MYITVYIYIFVYLIYFFSVSFYFHCNLCSVLTCLLQWTVALACAQPGIRGTWRTGVWITIKDGTDTPQSDTTLQQSKPRVLDGVLDPNLKFEGTIIILLTSVWCSFFFLMPADVLSPLSG